MSDSGREHAQAFGRFLAGIERRAFRIAQIGLRHHDDALDAVQDAMLQLARRYAMRPAEEWPPLFYRILENRIRDMQRRRAVRNRLGVWFGRGQADEDVDDAIAGLPAADPGPAERVELGDAMSRLESALRQLPPRQRQAFLLRNFEGLDVSGCAIAMGCSAGSVKTHYFRAIHTLRSKLEGFEP